MFREDGDEKDRLIALAAASAVVVASALLYGWAFPPRPHAWLAWVALVPFFAVIRRMTWRRRLALAWVWTVAMAYTVNDWFPRAVSGYFGQPIAIGILLFLGVSTFTAGVQYMTFGAMYPRLTAFGHAATPLLAAAAWVGADVLRLHLFGGDPWAILGYSQLRLLPFVQIADVTGVHGLTFVVVAVNAMLVETGFALAARVPAKPSSNGGRSRQALAIVLPVACVVLAVFLYGARRLRTPLPVSGARIPVGIVQAHLPLGSQWRRDLYGRNLDVYLERSLEVLRDAKPRLLVWPENAMTFFVADEPTYRASIASLLRPFGAELLAGGPQATAGDPPGYFNSGFAFTPNAEIHARYDKRLLLPFAEYFPFGGIDLLRRSFGRVREFTPGMGPTVLETALGPTGIVICNEGFFPEPAAERVRFGAVVLVNLSNDSWLADPKYSEPAFDMVTLRAVEQRRWVVRASTAGPSALIDPFGRVIERTRLFETTALAGEVEPRTDRTIYSYVGDVFAWSCAGLALLAVVVPALRSRSAR